LLKGAADIGELGDTLYRVVLALEGIGKVLCANPVAVDVQYSGQRVPLRCARAGYPITAFGFWSVLPLYDMTKWDVNSLL
jgi:hypothetical protein